GIRDRNVTGVQTCALPIFGHPDGEDWDFRTWLLKINNNDPEKVQWLLYVMGLCMLPNVNIGANVMLRGDSGSGKSTIGTLISKVYTGDRKSTRLNSSHVSISYAVFCLKKKKKTKSTIVKYVVREIDC